MRDELVSSLMFGKEMWATYFGDVGEEPSLPAAIGMILASPCPFWPGKRVAETHMLTLIPAKVNGQLLTLELMEELVKAPREGNATKYQYSDGGAYMKTPVARAHWALMTRDVVSLTPSRLMQIVEQKALHYEVPLLLDATVSIFVEYVRSGRRLYGDDRWTYTRCQEEIMPGRSLTVGGFTSAGLDVYRDDFGCYGVAALWRFVRHEPDEREHVKGVT